MQSNQTPNRWKAFGQRKSNAPSSMIGSSQSGVKQQKKYRPSKDRQSSASKIFNRSRSKYDSMIMMKQQTNSNYQKDKDGQSSRSKNFPDYQKNQIPQIQISQVASKLNLNEKQQKIKPLPTGREYQTKSNRQNSNQLKIIREDYNKFKQKIVTELELQKQNITKLINNILSSVKKQLQLIQKKYSALNNLHQQSKNDFAVGQTLQNIKNNFNLQKNQISPLSHKISTKIQNNKQLNSHLPVKTQNQNQVQNVQLVQKFESFFTALQGLKKDMNSLHELSSLQHITSPINSYHGSPLNSPKSDTFREGLLGFWKS